MSSDNLEELKAIFEYLNKSRHLPSFRLEPHAAPFFAVSLPQTFSNCLHIEIHETIIPEFPLRKGTPGISTDVEDPNGSNKVDFVAFSKDLCTTYFIELKTDTPTRFDPEQLDYLAAARGKKFGELVHGIIELAKNSDSKRKYVHLLNRLACLDIVGCMQGLNSYSFKAHSGASPGWTDEIDKLATTIETNQFSNIEVVFLLPNEEDKEECKKRRFEKFILFDDVIHAIKNEGKIGELFATYLSCWKEPAGSQRPSES